MHIGDTMTIDSLDIQPKQYGSPPGTTGSRDSGLLNGLLVRCELPVRSSFAGMSVMFAAVKEYFWPAPASNADACNAYAGRSLHCHRYGESRKLQSDPGQGSQYTYALTIKRVALVVAAAGIATAAYLVAFSFITCPCR